MELSTCIVKLAHIAAQNGGVLPLELCKEIEQYEPEKSIPTDFIKGAVQQTVNRALYGHKTNKR